MPLRPVPGNFDHHRVLNRTGTIVVADPVQRCSLTRVALHHDHDPEPPFKLANRVMKLPSDDAAGFAEFEERGAETKAMLLNLLPEGTSLEDKRLLDFGCGAGRTLRHFLGEAERAEIWGVDVDAASIEWLRENLCPPLQAAPCNPDPPLPFDDGISTSPGRSRCSPTCRATRRRGSWSFTA